MLECPLASEDQVQPLDDYVMQMPLRDVLELASVLGGPDPDTTLADLVADQRAPTPSAAGQANPAIPMIQSASPEGRAPARV